MGLFARLFAKNIESSSYIRRWLIREMARVDKGSTDPFVLFVELIDAASRFAKEVIPENKGAQEVAKTYLGDATIFEIACYTYYQMETWLYRNEPELRTQVADPVAFWLVEIFAVAWGKEEEQVRPFVAERLDAYRTAGKSSDREQLYLELSKRVLYSKGDQFTIQSEVHREPDVSFIRECLNIYEKNQITALINITREFCGKQVRPAAAESKKQLNLGEQADQEKRDYLFALALLEHKDLVKALRAFTKVLDINPQHYNALLQRGRIYIMQRQPLEAVDDFSRAIEVNPDDFRAYLERGKCYHRDWPMWDKAMDDYSKAISLAPNHAASYFERGSLFDEMDVSREKSSAENKQENNLVPEEFHAAIRDYSQAIALNPSYDEAYIGRGLAYARKVRLNKDAEMINKAVADMEKAMALNWENGYLYKTVDELKELLESDRQPELAGR